MRSVVNEVPDIPPDSPTELPSDPAPPDIPPGGPLEDPEPPPIVVPDPPVEIPPTRD